MYKHLLYLTVILSALLFSACIKNDIPYPRLQANFLTLEAKDQQGKTAIDSAQMTATITFPEGVDITNVRITGYSLTPGASITDNPFGDPVDLSSPLYVYLKYYQSWLWKIVAKQAVERYFEVDGQIGETVIDVPGKRIVVYVLEGTNLKTLKVKRAKLDQEGSTMSPDLSEGGEVDVRKPFSIETEVFGRKETWTLYVETVAEVVSTVSVDAWTCVAWVTGQAEAGLENGIEYRLAGTEEWTRVATADVTSTGGTFKGCIKHLKPETTYEARAYSGENVAIPIEFTTGTEIQIPNSNFEDWWLDGKIWCPWAENGEQFWGTGNPGAATVGQSNSVPTNDTPSGSGYAAKLETKWIVLKLAAGNIFTGVYVKTDGTNGILDFGRPFTQRPVKMRGKFKYDMKPIDRASDEFKSSIGNPDTATVWLALIDTPEPIEIRTNPKNRQLFDPNASYVVAYGKMECTETVPSYTDFEFDINYNSTSRVPTYIIVTASASKLGDYFTGGAGSTLYIDDFELVYDY